jgi:hypothetical protein
VAKVKKRTPVTGVRNTKPSKKAAPPAKGKTTRPSVRSAKSRSSKTKRAVIKVVAGKRQKAAAPAPVVRITVKPLDPLRKCGPGTTVQLLYRVDETVDGRSTAHLVFFDRHGWYCEHGRNCPAVGHARKHKGHIARVS